MRLRRPATAQVVGAFLAARADLAPDTLTRYRYTLGRLTKAHPRLPEDAQTIETFIASLPVGPDTRDDFWRDLHALYTWASQRLGVKNGMLTARRTKPRKKLRKTLTDDELERLLSRKLSRRDEALVTLILDTGIRTGEAHSITWPNINKETVRVTGKTGDRTITISPATRQALIGLGNAHHLWLGTRGPLTKGGLSRVIRRTLAAVDIIGGPQRLRHTFARQWLQNGGNIRTLQEMLGHNNLSTTALYLELLPGRAAQDQALYSPIARRAKGSQP